MHSCNLQELEFQCLFAFRHSSPVALVDFESGFAIISALFFNAFRNQSLQLFILLAAEIISQLADDDIFLGNAIRIHKSSMFKETFHEALE